MTEACSLPVSCFMNHYGLQALWGVLKIPLSFRTSLQFSQEEDCCSGMKAMNTCCASNPWGPPVRSTAEGWSRAIPSASATQ